MKDGNDDVSCDRDPDLSFYSVETIAIKMLDSKILFYPFEKKINTPTHLIEFGNNFCRNLQVIGKEDKVTFVFVIIKSNSA